MKVIKTWKDPMSALTHLIGLIFAIPCTIMLVYEAVKYATIWHVISLAIFGFTMICLYGASTIYHMLPVKESISERLRRIDHIMIFIFIAGTYTPVCLISLRGFWGWTILSIVWGIAIFGILLKVIYLNAPRWLSTSVYVIMGWIVIIAFYPLSKAISSEGIALLIAGGITYTIGAIIYGMEKPIIIPKMKWFGFHEIFHLFVMGGSLFHVLFMFRYIL